MKDRDLTQGSIGKNLFLFFVPVALGTVFQQLYNAADAVIVGKYVGTEALAAVGGSSANIINVLIGFFVALTSGAAVVVAHQYGAKNTEELKKSVSTGFTLCLGLGIVITVLGIGISKPLLYLLKTPEEIIEDSNQYLIIIFLGVVAQLVYNMEAGILHAIGDSKSPFLYLLIGCGSNILLDIIFVRNLQMGVAGAAYATIITQTLSAVLASIKLISTKEAYRIDVKKLGIHWGLLKDMLHLGIPAGLQSSMYSISNIIIQVGLNILGTKYIAAWSLTGKIDGFFWAISNAAGIAVMNFAAQNYGAGKLDRVRACQKIGLISSMLMTIGMSVLLLTLGTKAVPLFTDDLEVVEKTIYIMWWFVPFYFTWTLIEILSGIFRGVGDAVVPVIITGIGIAGFRVLWMVTAFQWFPNIDILSVQYVISWAITDVAFLIYYRSGKWQKGAKIIEE